MHRPNRIGQHVICDVDQALITRTDANFDSLDGSNDTFGMFMVSPAAGVNYMGDTVHWTTTPILADSMAVGFGVPVNVMDITRNPHLNVSAQLSYFNTDAVKVSCILGRLVAAPSLTAQVAITCPIHLPVKSYIISGHTHHDCDTSVVLQSGIAGGTPPSTEWDMVVFWHLANEAGATATFINLSARLSLWKWNQDLETLDPPR